MENQKEIEPSCKELSPYAGRWVAIIGRKVISQGGTPRQALNAAKNSRIKESPKIIYIPTKKPIQYYPPIDSIVSVLPSNIPIYLVGGAVSDAILHKDLHDLDFIVPDDGLKIGRKVADRLNAAYYPLDKERKSGRVVHRRSDGSNLVIDFTVRQGSNLESDLGVRDFTINAIAVDVNKPHKLLDPLCGAADLHAELLRACSPDSFISDPIRIIRGIRFAAELNFRFHPQTRSLMQEAIPLIPQTSSERLRDEFFKILDGPQVSISIQDLDSLDALHYLLPELSSLRGVNQSPPHHENAWNHSLRTVNCLSEILILFTEENARMEIDDELSDSLIRYLSSFKHKIRIHLETPISHERSLKSLINLAALYHDIGKIDTIDIDEVGMLHFYGHEKVGAQIINRRAKELRLSNAENGRLVTIIRNHMRPLLLAQNGRKLSRRAIYRFYKDTRSAGVDVCLLSLADTLATYNLSPPMIGWEKLLDVVRHLLTAWFDQRSSTVSPSPLISGKDLIEQFGLKPGPIIGELLDIVREAQAEGKVNTKEEAIEVAHRLLGSTSISD